MTLFQRQKGCDAAINNFCAALNFRPLHHLLANNKTLLAPYITSPPSLIPTDASSFRGRKQDGVCLPSVYLSSYLSLLMFDLCVQSIIRGGIVRFFHTAATRQYKSRFYWKKIHVYLPIHSWFSIFVVYFKMLAFGLQSEPPNVIITKSTIYENKDIGKFLSACKYIPPLLKCHLISCSK